MVTPVFDWIWTAWLQLPGWTEPNIYDSVKVRILISLDWFSEVGMSLRLTEHFMLGFDSRYKLQKTPAVLKFYLRIQLTVLFFVSPWSLLIFSVCPLNLFSYSTESIYSFYGFPCPVYLTVLRPACICWPICLTVFNSFLSNNGKAGL